MTTDRAPRPPKADAAKAAGAAKAAAPKAGTAKRGPGRPSNEDKLRAAVADTYTGVAMMAEKVAPMFGADPLRCHAAAQVVASQADACADAWVTLARTNPSVARTLAKMTEAGGWGSVVFAHVALGLSISMIFRAETPEAAALVGNLAANPEMMAAMMAAAGAPPAADG